MGLCVPWDDSYYHKWKQYQNLDNGTQITLCWKTLDHSQNNLKGISQWTCVPLVPALIYTTEILKNFGWFTLSQSINWWWQVQSQNRHPFHDLPQPCGGIKAVYPVWIWPTANFLTQPRTSFRINEHWSNKYVTENSTINKISLEQRTWRIF